MDQIICEIHKQEMKKHSNENGTWYSHKLADGTWCNGYEKKPKTGGFNDKKLDDIILKLDNLDKRITDMAKYLEKNLGNSFADKPF